MKKKAILHVEKVFHLYLRTNHHQFSFGRMNRIESIHWALRGGMLPKEKPRFRGFILKIRKTNDNFSHNTRNNNSTHNNNNTSSYTQIDSRKVSYLLFFQSFRYIVKWWCKKGDIERGEEETAEKETIKWWFHQDFGMMGTANVNTRTSTRGIHASSPPNDSKSGFRKRW